VEFTGERFVPGVGGPIVLEHLHRYAVAQQVVCGKFVLDIACGEGYGTSLLAQTARYVLGIDLSVETAAHASVHYRSGNVAFAAGACADIPVSTHSVDVVVSFETLEHHDQHERMMEEIKRVLRPGGVLLISTPDRHEYSDLPGYHNPFHVKELYRHEFETLLKSHFRHIALFGQRVACGSYLAPLSETQWTHHRTFRGDPRRIICDGSFSHAVYLVALACDSALPSVGAGLFEAQFDAFGEIEKLNAQLLAVRSQLLAMRESPGWRTLERLRGIRAQMLPPGSSRGRAFSEILRRVVRAFERGPT
jgi:O-antigen biosynthesis protein